MDCLEADVLYPQASGGERGPSGRLGTGGDLEPVAAGFGSYLFHAEKFVRGAAVRDVEDERYTFDHASAGW